MRDIKAAARSMARQRGHDINGQRWYHHTKGWATLECKTCKRVVDVRSDGKAESFGGYAINIDCDA
jgi:hypothetical protein